MTHAEREAERVFDALMTRVGEANPRPRLEPTKRLAALAGSPELSFPIIQIAGTNGKTSTSRAIESLLRAHGLKTGLFTSPHLVDFTERFQLDSVPVSGTVLGTIWDELQHPLAVLDAQLLEEGQGPVTFFEALTVLAFALFADAPVDVAVIEVGMGGEWDSTNAADAQVAVFCPIDLDHTAILGKDIETIARTKSKIMKPGCSVVSARQTPEALAVLEAYADKLGVPFAAAPRDFGVEEDLLAVGGRQVELRGLNDHRYEPVFVPLYGSHQAENVSVAVAAVEAFFGGERPIPSEVLEQGLGQTTSPGRLQLIGTDPIVYVDAAHNPHGAEALARAVTESFSFSELAVIVGILGDKDAHGVLAALAPIADRLFITAVDSPRAREAEDLADLGDDLFEGLEREIIPHLPEALDAARAWAAAGEARGVLVAGSVLLAGEAIATARAEGWGPA